MKRLLLILFSIVFLLSCEKDSDDPQSSSTSSNNTVNNGFPAKKDQELQGMHHGQNFTIQSMKTDFVRYDYDLNMQSKDITYIQVKLFDSLIVSPCTYYDEPKFTPVMWFFIPPAKGIYPIESKNNFNFPYLAEPYGPFANGVEWMSFVKEEGYVEVEEVDTNGRGSMTFYVYYKYETETSDENNNFIAAYNNLIEGRVNVKACRDIGRFEYLDQELQGTVGSNTWQLDHSLTSQTFSDRFDLFFYGSSGADSCNSDNRQFPRFHLRIADTLGLFEYGDFSRQQYYVNCTYDTTEFSAYNIQCGLKITEIDTSNKTIKGMVDLYTTPGAQIPVSVNGRFEAPYCF